MASAQVTTPADALLDRFAIHDGLMFAVDVRPHEIVIDCAFDTQSADGEWSRRPARIRLGDPAGCDLAFQYPKEVGLAHAGELGTFHKISASGPLDAAEFHLSFSYGAIRVSRCLLSIEGLDWEAMEALHPWLRDEPSE